MSIESRLVLHCDTDTCPVAFTAPRGVRTANALRTVAYRDHQWSTRRGDFCPAHNTRKATS